MAVILGVAFLAGTLVLTDTVTKTFDNILADANAGTDAYVRGDSPLDLGFGEQRPRIDDVARRPSCGTSTVSTEVGVRITGYAQIVDKKGKAVGRCRQRAVLGMNWVDVDELNPYRLAEGHAPSGRRRDRHRQALRRHRPASRPATHDRADAGCAARASPSSGIAKFGTADSPGGASSVLFNDADGAGSCWPNRARVDGVAFIADDGVSQAAAGRQLAAVGRRRRRGHHAARS